MPPNPESSVSDPSRSWNSSSLSGIGRSPFLGSNNRFWWWNNTVEPQVFIKQVSTGQYWKLQGSRFFWGSHLPATYMHGNKFKHTDQSVGVSTTENQWAASLQTQSHWVFRCSGKVFASSLRWPRGTFHRSICVFTGIHETEKSGSRYCSRHWSRITVMDALSKIHGSVLTEETFAETYAMTYCFRPLRTWSDVGAIKFLPTGICHQLGVLDFLWSTLKKVYGCRTSFSHTPENAAR